MELPLRWCSLADTSPPSTIALQPEPLQALVGHMPTGDGTVTAVTRVWRSGDTRRCRLCDHCTADHERDVCQVLVDSFVSTESGAALSTRGRTWCGPDSG